MILVLRRRTRSRHRAGCDCVNGVNSPGASFHTRAVEIGAAIRRLGPGPFHPSSPMRLWSMSNWVSQKVAMTPVPELTIARPTGLSAGDPPDAGPLHAPPALPPPPSPLLLPPPPLLLPPPGTKSLTRYQLVGSGVLPALLPRRSSRSSLHDASTAERNGSLDNSIPRSGHRKTEVSGGHRTAERK